MRFGLLIIFSFLLIFNCPSQTNFSTDPFGYVKLSITSGTGISRKVSLFSVPLLGSLQIVGASSGEITSTGANSITSVGAGWVEGELSNASMPHALLITSGQEEGRMFLISTSLQNTSDTVYIDETEFIRHGSLRGLSLNTNDSFRIIPVDTLSSFFGTPQTTLIFGGASSSLADVVTLVVNGSASSYYYNTSLNRWSRVALGNPDASNVPLLPYYGIQYARLAPTPLEFMVIGQVPMGKRVVPIKASGTSLLSQYWPGDMSLSSLGLNGVMGWRSGPTAASSDVIAATFGGSVSSYFYDGTNWRRVALGNPIANNAVFLLGSSLLISRKGNLTGYSMYLEESPY